MVDLILASLEAGDHGSLATGVFVGVGIGVFVGLMWLRVFRWIFALLGVRA